MKSFVFLSILLIFGNQLKTSQAEKEKSKGCNFACPTGYKLNELSCVCECEEKFACTKKRHFDNSTCSCVCDDNCLGCKAPQKWSKNLCECHCPNEYEIKCGPHQYFDFETCSCKCKETPAGCCKPHTWDKSSCACKCANKTHCPAEKIWDESECLCKCQKTKTCKSPFVWREESCSCGCPDIACIQNNIINSTTCKCECDQSLRKSCIDGVTTWNKYSCSCECLVTEDTSSCIDGTILDPTTCDTCIYPQTEACKAPQIWDTQTGTCDCGKIEECEIANDGGMHFWNPNKCACDCINSDKNCPVDTVFDYASCSCLCTISTKNCPNGETFDPVSCQCEAENPYANFIDTNT